MCWQERVFKYSLEKVLQSREYNIANTSYTAAVCHHQFWHNNESLWQNVHPTWICNQVDVPLGVFIPPERMSTRRKIHLTRNTRARVARWISTWWDIHLVSNPLPIHLVVQPGECKWTFCEEWCHGMVPWCSWASFPIIRLWEAYPYEEVCNKAEWLCNEGRLYVTPTTLPWRGMRSVYFLT